IVFYFIYLHSLLSFSFFFFNDPAPTEIYTLSLHDALPILNNTHAKERSSANFDVSVIGHLRAVKDPFRTAMASRLLPDSSKIRILQVGGAMTDAMANRARKEMSVNKRYRWLGEQSQLRALQILKKSSLCVLSSR